MKERGKMASIDSRMEELTETLSLCREMINEMKKEKPPRFDGVIQKVEDIMLELQEEYDEVYDQFQTRARAELRQQNREYLRSQGVRV